MQVIVAVVYALVLTCQPTSVAGEALKGDRTITKVVKLLQGMMKKSSEDGDKDRDLYAKFKCYCDNNEVDYTERVAETKKEIRMLENDINKVQSVSGELSTECADLTQGIADNEAARESATGVRDKAKEDFVAEEKDMVGALESMDKAIETLAAVGADQTAAMIALHDDHAKFMGPDKTNLLKLQASVKAAMSAVSVLLTPSQRQTFSSFIQAPFTGTYTSQSGEIVGILKNMRDTFDANLATARSAEKAAAEAYKKFMEIKESEHKDMTASLEEKQAKSGENDDELAGLRTSLEEAQKSLASDEEFLAKLLTMCAEKAKEFTERNLLRANEEAAISEAIAILNSDAAFEAFGKVGATKSGATGFLQIAQHNHHGSVGAQVLQRLEKASKKLKSLKLARIVVLLQAENPFDTVLVEIEKMIKIIDEEQKQDEEQKEWCGSEREFNHAEKEKKEGEITAFKDEITTLDDTINNEETGLKAQIATTESDIKTNHDDQVSSTSERQEENRLYQTKIKNTVAAETLVAKAIKILTKFYGSLEKESEEKFLQTSEDPDPPDTFEGEGQKDAGADVIGMLKFIVEETQKEEQEAHTDENAAQHAFEDAMADLKSQQAEMEESLAALKVELAEKEKTLAETRVDLANTEAALKEVEKYLFKIKPGCDFIEEKFEDRTKARGAEKDALKEAVGLLKDTPAYKAAVHAADQEALGECKDICNKEGEDHAKCKACLAGTSVPGFCAGHKDTAGC